MSDDARLGRIEEKVDQLASAMTQLVRMEERQLQASAAIAAVDKKADEAIEVAEKADRKIDTWVNRGLGLWGAAMAVWAIANSAVLKALIGGP